jgi:hypothetical protein
MQNTDGKMASFKEITTSLNGWSRGDFYFSDTNGEEYRVLVECPQIIINPNCVPDDGKH